MNDYGDETYGEAIAEVYDTWYQSYDERMIAILHELAGEGPALELAIGTGRVALPLQEMGTTVHGIDASPAMVAKLREKPGGADMPVEIGNFADVGIEGAYSLIFVVFNTFYGLLTQAEQIRCFENVAKHLTPNGRFVIEVFMPDLGRYIDNQTMRTNKVEADGASFDVSRLDLINQQISVQHMVIKESGVRFYPVKLRYAWPSELDLMARIAGLELKERWSDWSKGPFSNRSGFHISVYGPAV